MKGSKYLSELVDIHTLKKDQLNIIQAPTGSGKTYFALTAIPAETEDAFHNVVYLIDTINGKEQIVNNYNATSEAWPWSRDIVTDGHWFSSDDRIVVITYARFGCLIDQYPDFHTYFDYIICDELHNLIAFQYFSLRPNAHSVAKRGLESAVRNGKTTVVALTATPQKVREFFNAPYYNVPIDQSDLRQYEVRETVPYTDLNYLIFSLDPADIGVCYYTHISGMIGIETKAREAGLSPISIWSIRNPDHPMNHDQLAARDIVLKEFRIPEEYNLLIINSSSETSIKIKSPVDYVIVHSTDRDTITQVRGRVNHDLETLYLPGSKEQLPQIPDEFLNTPLSTVEKNALCDILNIRDTNGRSYRWPTIKGILIDHDYIVEETRSNNRRIATIRRSE